MVGQIHKRARAKRDLVEHYLYLAENAGIETAERFLQGAEKSFDDLSRYPDMGTPLLLRPSSLAGLRKWPVSGFEKFLIFYIPRSGGVSVVRLMHAAQDWWGSLGIL